MQFDFGRTSVDYAKYRDIYPQEFYERIIARNLCISGQVALDVGTGTGVLPRNLHRYGAKWTGVDVSENQIEQARILSAGMDIEYHVAAAEDMSFPESSFDVVTACQCFSYFDHKRTAPLFRDILKPDGRLLLLYMAWLPFEDEIAGASESLTPKYSPDWSGAGETMHPIELPECYGQYFQVTYREEFPLSVRFTRESWNGRMKTCRGIGASLPDADLKSWEQEHVKMLADIAPEEFDIQHYAALLELEPAISYE